MRYIVVFLFIPILFSNCGDDEIIQFRMEYRQDFEISAGLNPFEVWYFEINNVDSNAADYFSTFDVQQSDVTAINPGSAQMSLIAASNDYDFIEDISVRMYLEDPAVYKEIFFRDNLPNDNSRVLDLIPTLVDVQDWIVEDSYNILVRIQFRQAPPEFFDNRLDFDFLVK